MKETQLDFDDFDFGGDDDFGSLDDQDFGDTDSFDEVDFGDTDQCDKGRRESDFYPTPPETVRSFLQTFDMRTGHLTRMSQDQSLFLDPCSGGMRLPTEYQTGPYPAELLKFGIPSKYVFTNDIRTDAAAAYNMDFLKQRIPLPRRPECIISNPPYRFAVEFIDRALDLVNDHGWVIFLLRLNFLGAQKRYGWWQQEYHRPYGVFIHSDRPSFTEDGKTDGTEYAHFVWWKNKSVKTTMLDWCNSKNLIEGDKK